MRHVGKAVAGPDLNCTKRVIEPIVKPAVYVVSVVESHWPTPLHFRNVALALLFEATL